MKRMTLPMISLFLSAALLGGCAINSSSAPLTSHNRAQIRVAAQEFSEAIRTGNAQRMRDATLIADDADSRRLSNEIIGDTVSARKVLNELAADFDYYEIRPTVIASDPWLNQLQTSGSRAPIYRVGPDRAVIQIEGQGNLYLHQINGAWKVELVPTLVPESNGETTVTDPVVEYRFAVTRATNEWMLTRLEHCEFRSKEEFDAARNRFWTQYLTAAANGKDPRDTVLSSLPAMPLEDSVLAGDE